LKEAASVCFVRSFGHDSTALCPRPYSFMHGVGDLPGADTSPLPVPVVVHAMGKQSNSAAANRDARLSPFLQFIR
jgi:hypothetical protein